MTLAPSVAVSDDGDGGAAPLDGNAPDTVTLALTGGVAKGSAMHPGAVANTASALRMTRAEHEALARSFAIAAESRREPLPLEAQSNSGVVIEHTAVHFETVPATIEEFASVWTGRDARPPLWLAAELDDSE